MLKIPGKTDILGADHHRSGWKYALSCLAPLESPDGILLEDFVDRRFGWEPLPAPIREPWVGIFHKPPGWPDWLGPPGTPNTPRKIIESDLFRQSLPELRLAITMSRYLADWLEKSLGIPTAVTRHPTEIPEPGFSPERFLEQSTVRVVQIGYVLRNTEAIYQLEVPGGFEKVHLRCENESALRTERQVREYWLREGTRKHRGTVHRQSRLPDGEYDDWLGRSIVFLELFDTSVSNTAIECLARATPLLVNRLSALEEILGEGYPLFYDSLEEASSLLDEKCVLAAHHWLRGLDRDLLSGNRFREDIARFIREMEPGKRV